MQQRMSLVRELLLSADACDAIDANPANLYLLDLLKDAGLAESVDERPSPRLRVRVRLTLPGREFLEAARDASAWSYACAHKSGTSLSTAKEILLRFPRSKPPVSKAFEPRRYPLNDLGPDWAVGDGGIAP